MKETAAKDVTNTKPILSVKAHRATGPRTTAGKERSRYNAVKGGIFAKTLLLKEESADAFQFLRRGVFKDLSPEGVLETEVVEQIASLCWRHRRVVRAEGAEISKVAEFADYDSVVAQLRDADEVSRAQGFSAGMAMAIENPYVIEDVIPILRRVREGLTSPDPLYHDSEGRKLLQTLYGLHWHGPVPLGLEWSYCLVLDRMRKEAHGGESRRSSEPNIKKALEEVVQMFDEEIRRLEGWAESGGKVNRRLWELQATAAVIPPQEVVDRIVRYETHIGRQIDRLLSRLDWLQQRRHAQPGPPEFRVRLNA